MPEWFLVVLAGALGALVTDFYQRRGTHRGIPRPGFSLPWFFVDDVGIHRFDPGTLASLALGGIAGVITILSVDAPLIASPTPDWNSALGAFLAGIASDAFLKRLIREAQEQVQNSRRLESLASAIAPIVATSDPAALSDDPNDQKS